MILCADDFAISPGVSLGILRLVEMGRLSAVSCMVTEPGSRDCLRLLEAHHEHVDVGLHIVLTECEPLSSIGPSSGLTGPCQRMLRLGALIRRAYFGRLDAHSVELEIRTQFERFTELTGKLPAFVDGHQHVQQLPGIREALGRVLNTVRVLGCYCRTSELPPGSLRCCLFRLGPMAAVGNVAIAASAEGLKRLCDEHNIPTNRYLLGYHNVRGALDFADVFSFYLSMRPGHRDIFFCHPGKVDHILRQRDPMMEPREVMLEFLTSDRAGEALDQYGVTLSTFHG